MPVNTELAARLLQPIRDDAPAGTDLTYDPRVDVIKEARREEADLPTNNLEYKRKLADWPVVIAGATELLTKETKDLQIGVWLAEAMLQKEGYGGLATGLDVLTGLVSQFWDTVHPLPEDDDIEGRLMPLVWLGGKLVIPVAMVPFGTTGVSFLQIEAARTIPTEAEADNDALKREQRASALEQGKPAPEAVNAALDKLNKSNVRAVLADLDAALKSLGALEKAADERFGREAPAFNGLRSAIDEIKRYGQALLSRKIELDPDPEVAEDSTEAEGAAISGDDSAPLSVEPTNRTDASLRLAVVAKWFRTQDAANPAPYLLLRGFRWGELRVAAPDLDPKLLEAPPTATRARLKSLLLDGKWTELLEQSETLMATAPGRGWLDLQRYMLTACAGLGSNYDGVAAAVRSELRELLSALPQLTRMTLMDDTPTANEETREWLSSNGLVNGGHAHTRNHPAGGDAAASTTDAPHVLAEALDDDSYAAQQGGFSRARPVRRPARARDVFDLACGELALGRPNRAIEVLMAELARDQSARGRLVRQTQIAYIMVEAGLDAVAAPILRRIIETIDERNLEQWESGPLVAQPMALLCRVLERTQGDETERGALYLRVCRLDPLQALSLQAPPV